MARLHRFQLLSDDQIENSPSRRCGVKFGQERSRLREVAVALFKTSQQFSKPAIHAQTAVTLFVRFYSRKSLTENSAAVFGAAAIFLAGKVVNEPVTIQWVSAQFFKNYYERGNPHMEEKIKDFSYMNVYYASVLEAEVSLLCTLGFDLDIPTLDRTFNHLCDQSEFFKHIHKIGSHVSVKREQKERMRTYFQCLRNMLHDIYKRDPQLLLQFSCQQLTVASAAFLLRHAEKKKDAMLDVPPPDAYGQAPRWYEALGLTEDELTVLFHRFSHVVYPSSSSSSSSAAAAASSAPTPTATTVEKRGTNPHGQDTKGLPEGEGVSVRELFDEGELEEGEVS